MGAMDASTALPSDSNPTPGGASKFLADLPSRGLFSSTVPSSNPVLRALIVRGVQKSKSPDQPDETDLKNKEADGFVLRNGWQQGGMRVYICDHDTSPPATTGPCAKCEDQLIKTNQTNILIRSLVLKKQKGDSSSKDVKTAAASEASRKRPAEKVMDGRASAKRAATNTQEGSKSRVPEKDLHSLTVERLRALLREKGLSNRGKKDELVARLRSASG
ncbi:unnamed protein product [Camellia sinensis]